MATRKLLLLPGDGIGPEAMAEVRKLIAYMNAEQNAGFETEEGLVGGSAYDACGQAISEDDMAKAMAADAVLFGAVGGPKWDGVPYEVRPEAGLLRLRKDMELFANLRPAICYPALAASSSLKPEVVEGLDILIVRELTGGVYFGEPKEIIDLGNGQKRAIDTQVYDTFEIERISGVAFELARTRSNKVCSMEKHNVMKSGVLWRDVVAATHKAKYADVELTHMLADAGGMQLVRWPKQFDVIVTDLRLPGSDGISVLRAARDACSGRVIAIAQPHRFTRLHDLFDDFAACFNDADIIAVAPVYTAGEDPIEGVNSGALVEKIRAAGHRDARAIDGPQDIAPMVRAEAKPGDYVVLLGAGNISQWAYALPRELEGEAAA